MSKRIYAQQVWVHKANKHITKYKKSDIVQYGGYEIVDRLGYIVTKCNWQTSSIGRDAEFMR